MATKPRIKWKNILVWYVLLSALLLLGGPLLIRLDSMLYQSAASYAGMTPPDKLIHLAESEETAPKEQIEYKENFVPTDTYHHEGARIGKIYLSAAEDNAQNLAVYLKWLAQGGVEHVALSLPLTWEKEVVNAEQSLLTDTCRSDNLFKNAVLGLSCYSAKMASKTPGQLRFCEIPANQISGSTALLPSANRAKKNYLESWPDAVSLNWAPDLLKMSSFKDATQSYPLLVRWNGEVYPTLPLRLAMEMKKLKPTDIKVVLGKHIRIGDLVLPLDSRGCVPLSQASTVELKWDSFGPGAESKPAQGCEAVVMLQPEDDKDASERLNKLAATVSMLCAKQTHEVIMQNGEPVQVVVPAASYLCYAPLIDSLVLRIIAVLVLMFIAVRFIPSMSKWVSRSIMLIWLLVLLKLAWDALMVGTWFHIGVMLCVWALLLIVMPSLRPVWRRGIFSSRR